jgi:hypothetical protein
VAKFFGLGMFAAFLFADIANVYVVGAVDRWLGVSVGFRLSIVVALVLSLISGWLFSLGSGEIKLSAGRALGAGIVVTLGYWSIVALVSIVLLHYSTELSFGLALLPLLVLSYFTPGLARSANHSSGNIDGGRSST